MTERAWIAADWGTSNLRIWAIDPQGEVLAERSSSQGMGTLRPDAFEAAFLALTHDLIGTGPVDVLVCGMAGAKQGWAEAGYAAVPCPPVMAKPICVKTADPRLNVRILSGLKQLSPPDVMRGEETQIAGFLSRHAGFSGVLALPGTHSKWAHISNGEVQTFRSFMTGELFDLTCRHSTLRHAIGTGWDEGAFRAGVRGGYADPDLLGARMFSIRAASLLEQTTPEAARARLSGLLIGSELRGTKDYWNLSKVHLIGDSALCMLYARALTILGGQTELHDGAAMALSGLKTAYHQIKGTRS